MVTVNSGGRTDAAFPQSTLSWCLSAAHQGELLQALERSLVMSSHGCPIRPVPENPGKLGFDIQKFSKMMRDSGSCLCVQVVEGKSYCDLKIELLFFFSPRKYLEMGLDFQT